MNYTKSNSLSDLRERVKEEHAGVIGSLRRGLDHAFTAGALLAEAKIQLRHGEWLPWLKSCGIEERTAQRYLKLAKNRALIEAKSDSVTDLNITGALALIAVPRSEDESSGLLADLAGHAADGALDTLETTLQEIEARSAAFRAPAEEACARRGLPTPRWLSGKSWVMS